MDEIMNIPDVETYDRLYGVASRHPHVNVIEGSRLSHSIPNCRKNLGVYVVFLKDVRCADYLAYGRQEYDYQENTLVFAAPGQVFGHPRDGSTYRPSGWVLYFSRELLHATSLGRKMKDYEFFGYSANEALHVSAREREVIVDCLKKIDEEIESGADSHSDRIIASAIELFLNYCLRFYDRQFATRRSVNKDVLVRFEELVDDYLGTGRAAENGTPTVAWCARQLCLSPNYFGSLVKKETGKTAQEYLQGRLMEAAKDELAYTGKSIGEIAYELGYQYPQYFSRAFKREVGLTPNEWRRRFRSGRK